MTSIAANLFERFRLDVYRYFRLATGSHELSEDLTQETFLRVARAAGRPVDREIPWLFKIAHNVLVDEWRKPNRREVPLHEGGGTAGWERTHLAAFSFNEALALLSPEQREALVMKEIAGLTYAEMAAACGTTEDAVKSRLFRARQRIRQLLGNRLSSDVPEIGTPRRGYDA